MTASPEGLVVLAYDGLLRLLSEAREACAGRDYESVNDRLVRAQGLISELDDALDSRAGDVAGALRSLYAYLGTRLLDANARKDVNVIDEVASLLRPLRDAWGVAAEYAGIDEERQTGERGGDR